MKFNDSLDSLNSLESLEGNSQLLRVHQLRKWFPVKDGFVNKMAKAVDGVSFTLNPGETLGIVGESGSGKSTLGRSLIRLIEPTAGEVWFEDINLLTLSARKLRKSRKNFQMVFQDPYASLNPRQKIGDILLESLKIHRLAKSRQQFKEKVVEILELVGIPPEYANRFPHELSGGQRQRIGIARALAVSPKLIVFDEAVSALDVSIQAQILNLIKDLQQKLNLAYVFITHDLSVVRHIATHIGVMYLGEMVEFARTEEIFNTPRHPYTKALLSVVPLANNRNRPERIRLKGEIPSLVDPPQGCRFHTRCPIAEARCSQQPPPVRRASSSHQYSCLVVEPD